MTKNKNLLRYGLGGLTVVAILAVLLFSFGNWGGKTNEAAGTTTVDALEAQNESLRQTVTELQVREAEYRRQIEAANATIEELSGGADLSASAGQPFGAPGEEQREFNGAPSQGGFFGFLGEGHSRGEHARGFEHSEG